MSEDLFDNLQPDDEAAEVIKTTSAAGSYTDDSIQTLSWNEHIREPAFILNSSIELSITSLSKM